MVSFDDLVRKHGRVKLYDDVCVEHIGFYAVESCACMGFIVYRDVEMIGAGSTVLEAMRSAGEGLRLEQPAAAVPAIPKALRDEWRSERNRGMTSALGEYTPREFWDLLDAYEALLDQQPAEPCKRAPLGQGDDMSTKHTPGPWHYKPHAVDSNYMLIFCSSDQQEGDNLRGYCGEANARLIAAAPELLEALKEIIAAADGDGWNQLDASFATARAAIAKAVGHD